MFGAQLMALRGKFEKLEDGMLRGNRSLGDMPLMVAPGPQHLPHSVSCSP